MIIPCLLVTPVTDALIAVCADRISTLDVVDRAFVEAGPSPRRQALRIAQLELVRKSVQLFGLTDAEASLFSDENGRPCFPPSIPLHLSVSHCDDALAVAISCSPIGVDIERLRTMPRRPMDQLFSPAELAGITDDESFTRAWVRKEAYAKWLGSGLRDELASGDFQTETETRNLNLASEKLYLGLAGEGCSAAQVHTLLL